MKYNQRLVCSYATSRKEREKRKDKTKLAEKGSMILGHENLKREGLIWRYSRGGGGSGLTPSKRPNGPDKGKPRPTLQREVGGG